MHARAWTWVFSIILCGGAWGAEDVFTAPPPDGRLSLEAAVQLALEHNEAIRRAQLAEKIAQLNAAVVRANYNPLTNITGSSRGANTRSRDTVSLGGQTFGTGAVLKDSNVDNQVATVLSKRWTSGLESSLTGSAGYNTDSDVPSAVEWNASYPLTPKQRARIREEVGNARLAAEQGANTTVVTEEEIRFAVISAYYSVVQASEQVKIVADFLGQSKSILDYNQSMLSGGFAAPLQVDESRIEVQRREADLIGTEDLLTSRREALNLLVGIPVEASYVLHANLGLVQSTKTLDDWVGETLGSNLDLVNFDKSLAMQANSLEVTRRLDQPEVNLGASARRTEEGEEVAMLELTLFWPLFDGGVRKYLTESAHQDIESTKVARWSLERQLVQAVRDDYRRLASEWTRAKILEQSVSLAQRNIDIARENYEAGRLPYRNFVDIQLDLANARDGLVQSQVAYKVALARLASRIHPAPREGGR